MNERLLKEILEFVKSDDFKRNPCFYIYDTQNVSHKIDRLADNLPKNIYLYYAMKANPNRNILFHMRNSRNLSGIEIASAGELEKALEFFNPGEVIFTGPGKNIYELEQCVRKQIKHVNIESYVEALKLNGVIKKINCDSMDALVRVNIDYSPENAHTLMSGFSSKFGIDEERIRGEIERISKLDGLNFKGIHVFAGSGMLDYSTILNYFKHIFDLASRLEKSGLNIYTIDLGGGLGIDYEGKGRSLDISSLGRGMNELIVDYGFEGKELLLELGRYLVGEAGYYVTEILDIKESKGKKHIITAGGINHQRRPCATETNHPIEIIPLGQPFLYDEQIFVKDEVVEVGGPLCLSADILAKDVYIKSANIGDLVVVLQSGAYGLSMAATEFLSHQLPPELFI